MNAGETEPAQASHHWAAAFRAPDAAPLWLIAAMAAASALTFVLAFAPVGAWPLAPLSVGLLAWSAAAGRRGGVVVAVIALAWIPAWWWFHRWIGAVSAAGLPALVLYLAGCTGLIALVLRRLLRADPTTLIGRLPTAAKVAIGFVGAEAARAVALFEGYPWYLLVHPLIERPLLVQTADLGGQFVPALLVAAVGGALLDLTLRGRRAWRGIAIVALLVLAAIGYGAWRLSETAPLRRGPTVLAIQTNLPSDNKIRWKLERQIVDFDDFVRLTLDGFDDARRRGHEIELFAWPETMLPGFGLDPETEAALLAGPWEPADRFTAVVRLMTRSIGVPMLLGSGSYEGLRPHETGWAWDRHHNSGYLIRPDGAIERYDKLVLTPFGETMPYISKWPWLEARFMALGARGMRFELDRGREPVRLTLPTERGPVRLATPICFEDTVAALCRRLIFDGRERRADLLVNLSNDGWFGDVDAGRWQHAQAARFRCIENRTPMIRVVNTGVTAAYDSSGRLLDLVGDHRSGAGWLIAAPDLDRRRPLAATVGDAVPWLAMALTIVLVAATMVPRRRGGSGHFPFAQPSAAQPDLRTGSQTGSQTGTGTTTRTGARR